MKHDALWLADALDELDASFSRSGLCGDAAHELRRLHTANAELLMALKNVMSHPDGGTYRINGKSAMATAVRAVIARAEGDDK
jgi:hypothetical protein